MAVCAHCTHRTRRPQLGPDAAPALEQPRPGQPPLHVLAGNRAVQRLVRPTPAATPVVQRIALESHNGLEPARRILVELNAMFTAGEAKRGEERGGEMLTRLKEISERASSASSGSGPKSSQATYGISGASYFPGVETIAVQGPAKYLSSVQGVVPDALGIGNRETRVHDEVAHVKAYPGVQAIYSTQANCMFCYCMLEQREYQHGPLRAKPWPQDWAHDYMKFELQQTNPDLGAVARNIPVLKITTTLSGTPGYYRVEDKA